jgi:hypothetical protein
METLDKNETQKNETMPHAQQWKVSTENYAKTFEAKDPAKRQFGKICATIEEEGQGWVLLEYRPAATTKKAEEWIEVEEFELSSDDDDEEDD